jgi:hypothetical protein
MEKENETRYVSVIKDADGNSIVMINDIITTCEKTPSDEIGCGMNRTSFSFCISPS